MKKRKNRPRFSPRGRQTSVRVVGERRAVGNDRGTASSSERLKAGLRPAGDALGGAEVFMSFSSPESAFMYVSSVPSRTVVPLRLLPVRYFESPRTMSRSWFSRYGAVSVIFCFFLLSLLSVCSSTMPPHAQSTLPLESST